MERWLILVWSFLFALLGEAQVRVSAWPEGKDGLERSPDYDVTVKSLAGGSGNGYGYLIYGVMWIPDMCAMLRLLNSRWKSRGGPSEELPHRCMGREWQMQVKVKPSSRGIACRQVDARTVEFTLHRPEFLSVEFNGERKQNLHIFANDMFARDLYGEEPDAINWKGKERTRRV